MANVRIKVPQSDGEIRLLLSRPGEDEPVTYKVTDGHVSVKDTDADRFVAAVNGSKVAGESGGSSSTSAK